MFVILVIVSRLGYDLIKHTLDFYDKCLLCWFYLNFKNYGDHKGDTSDLSRFSRLRTSL